MSTPSDPPSPLGNLVAAHFQRLEVAMLARVLTTTLAGALPPSMVRVEWRRGLRARLGGNSGIPIGVSITAGDRTLTFRAPEIGVIEAGVSHTVHGIVLSSTAVTVQEWLRQLGEVLDEVSAHDQSTRIALEQALLPPPSEPPATPPPLGLEPPALPLEPPAEG